MDDLLKNRRVQIFIISIVFIGLIPIALIGVEFGMDFTGGTLIKIALDRPLDAIEMETMLVTMTKRLNAFGLKEITVKPWGQQFVRIEIAETDPGVVNRIQALMGEQGYFETLFDGKVVLTGADILQVITTPQEGYGIRSSGQGYEWSVPFLLSNDAATRLAVAIEGRCTPTNIPDQCAEQLYMFIDRPENVIVLINFATYDVEKMVPSDFESSTTMIPIEDIAANSDAELITTNFLDNETLQKLKNRTVLIVPGSFDSGVLNASGANVIERKQVGSYWIQSALSIENIIHLTAGVTTGRPITNPRITGSAPTEEDAFKEMNRVVILMKSGRLPVSVSIGGVSTISPTLGMSFLNYSMIAGVVAIIIVGGIVFIRYRKLNIALPIVMTSVSEVIIIGGVASLIGWQIDLAAIAGIIAAVGTGVDHKILITDEILREEEDIGLSLARKINKAFSIIFMAAATTIFAMLPLLMMGMGALQGFALTTILGSLIGVFIARPAFAQIIRRLLSE